MLTNKVYLSFPNNILLIGCGSIGKAIIPLILRHIDIKRTQLTIISKKADGETIAQEYGLKFIRRYITQDNYQSILEPYLNEGDFLLNLSVDISSVDLIKLCWARGCIYLDTCIEPWSGVYVNPTLTLSDRSNYALRYNALKLKQPNSRKPTALIAHGANPGLISHFVKQAIRNIACDNELNIERPRNQRDWAKLAEKLGIKALHVAECDSQVAEKPKEVDEFVNTWSIDGFVAEGSQPAELGWGSHEKHWPADARHHTFGCQSAIYLDRPGAATKVRSWTPLHGPYHGFLITHNESISIADYFSYKEQAYRYRPTVHYAYLPCADAVLSLHELAGREWQQQKKQRLLFNEIIEGTDALGILVMGNPKGAYWFGSQLNINEARKLAPHNNATSLQVAIGVLAGMLWVIEHPTCGLLEPDEIDHEYIMKIATPYLGNVAGYYTEWTPLKDRAQLFSETIDSSDPWQFINMRVS